MGISGINPLLQYVSDMMKIFGESKISIPSSYRGKVQAIKGALNNDVSGMVSSILDFAINTSLVKFRVETGNSNLNDRLNNWLKNINSDLRGKIPVGLKALAKEYFRERWKNGSFHLLRTKWFKEDGYIFPKQLWFVEGEDIIINNNDKEVINLGDEKYSIYISGSKQIPLPREKNEKIYVQKPFSSWGEDYPVPFLIQRGVYKNMKLLALLEEKGENIIGRALEYLLFMKKGTERSALEGRGDFIYDQEDLKAIKTNFKKFLDDRKTNSGVDTYVSNFDTEIQHLIPEYKKGLESSLFEPIQKRILAGLGLIDIAESLSVSRRDSILNPKTFISEVNSGIEDFKTLIEDILETIVLENAKIHPKYFKNSHIKLHTSPVTEFISDDLREHLRSAYDRGPLSKRTYLETVCELDYDIEVERRQEEFDKGHEELLYPHVTINKEGTTTPTEERRFDKIPNKEEEEETPEDKDNKLSDRDAEPERKNFQSKIFEQAPYKKNTDLPPQIKDSLPSRAQTIFRKTFNKVYEETNDDNKARQAAWNSVKQKFEKKDNKWVNKLK